jgi:flavodoxin
MKTLVVYDSQYGNTEKIARAIGASLTGEVKVLRSNEVNIAELNSYDLIIAGAPTQAGRPMLPMQEFFKKIPDGALSGKKVAAFDTRLTAAFTKIFGYAAGKIEAGLKAKGGNAVAPAEWFYVGGGKVPQLKEGEPERAAAWAKTLVK